MVDSKQPQIIKSGAMHSVEVAQGTKNAKSSRNYVKPQEEEGEDRFATERQAEQGDQAA